MVKVALYVRLEAKPGKEKDVAQFLEAGLGMANQETTTPVWFALQLSPSVFGIFDAFDDESGRQAHLNGPIAKALMAKAGELLFKAACHRTGRCVGRETSRKIILIALISEPDRRLNNRAHRRLNRCARYGLS